MGLFGQKFEEEERAFIKEITEKGVSFEEIAKIRVKYGDEFDDKECFESFKRRASELIPIEKRD